MKFKQTVLYFHWENVFVNLVGSRPSCLGLNHHQSTTSTHIEVIHRPIVAPTGCIANSIALPWADVEAQVRHWPTVRPTNLITKSIAKPWVNVGHLTPYSTHNWTNKLGIRYKSDFHIKARRCNFVREHGEMLMDEQISNDDYCEKLIEILAQELVNIKFPYILSGN